PWYQRLPHFRPELTPSAGKELQSEFYLPRAVAPQAFAALRKIGDRIAPVLHISEVRTIRADDLWLSPAHERDSVAVHFTWQQCAEWVPPVVGASEEVLPPLGARPLWGKITTLPAGRIVDSYTRAGDFARLLELFDPDGKFRNPFVDALFPRT